MNYLTGINVGTSATKTILFDEAGTVVALAFREYSLYQPKNGWAEQKPKDWRDAVLAALEWVTSQAAVEREAIKSIGISGQVHGLMMLDEAGGAIRLSIIWRNQRTGEKVGDMLCVMPKKRWIGITANLPLTGWAAAKIL